jgi:hypothetical protein
MTRKSTLIAIVLVLVVAGVFGYLALKDGGFGKKTEEGEFQVVSSDPKNEETEFSSNSNIELNFSEDLGETPQTALSKITMSPQVGFSVSIDGRHMIIDPYAPLTNKQYYTLTIAGLESKNKNTLATYTLAFQAVDLSAKGKIINSLPVNEADYRIEYLAYTDTFLVTISSMNYDEVKKKADAQLTELGIDPKLYKVEYTQPPTLQGHGAPPSDYEAYD